MKKYEFTGETMQISSLSGTATLHRIRAVLEFDSVKIGDLGGWIEKEENLSHVGDAWLYGNAKVWGNAEVWGNAKVYGNAAVWGNVEVFGDAELYSNAKVYGNAAVWGNAKVWSNAKVRGNAKVCGNAKVWSNAEVCDNAKVYGNAEVCDNAKVFSASHVLVIGAIGSRDDFTTFFRDKDGEITVKCGCFLGKIDRFLKKVTSTHGNSKYALVYQAAVEVAKLQIETLNAE